MKIWFLIFTVLFLFISRSFAQQRDLNFYIQQGISNSPLLKDYNNQVFLNSIDSQRIWASYHPQVMGTSNNYYAPVMNGYGYDLIVTNGGNYNALINVNQSFVGRGNLKSQFSSLKLLSDSLNNQKRISEQDLKRSITAQYITAYGDLQQLHFNQDINKMLRNEETILKKLAENNIYRQTDYLTFLVTFQQQELQLKQIKIQYQADFATLNYLCGIFDTSTVELEAPAVTLQYLPDSSSSVFFLRYKTDSLRLENAISVLNYNYHPKLGAFANAGYLSSMLYQADKNFGFSVGFNLFVPIYDGHQKRMQAQKIKILENTNTNYHDFFVRQYNQQIAQLKQQLSATDALIEDINSQIKYAEGLINVNGKLLQTGDTKIADYVIAINNYLTAKNLLTQNSISRMQIINQLNYWNR
jgi:outer membrane protein TolC